MSVQAALRIKTIVDELLTTRIADLTDQAATQRRLGELRAAIDDVQTFAQSLEGLLGRIDGPAPLAARAGRRPGRPAKVRLAPASRPRGRRGPGDFAATPFILDAVRASGKSGIRPREIVAKVVEAAPGHHVRPSALVSTILTRLKVRGDVGRRAGKWFARA